MKSTLRTVKYQFKVNISGLLVEKEGDINVKLRPKFRVFLWPLKIDAASSC
jgi:hypothetical protein